MHASATPQITEESPWLALIWEWIPGIDHPWGVALGTTGLFRAWPSLPNQLTPEHQPLPIKNSKGNGSPEWMFLIRSTGRWCALIARDFLSANVVPRMENVMPNLVWQVAVKTQVHENRVQVPPDYEYRYKLSVCLYLDPILKTVHQVDINTAKSKNKRRNQESESKHFCLWAFQIRVTWPIRNAIYQRILETARWGKAGRILVKTHSKNIRGATDIVL